jgi:hypothetical protein
MKRTFTNFPTDHHNLGSSRATSSRLGGFTSKSKKCHKHCFTKLKCSSAHKEDLTQLLAWISHKSHKPHLEVKERGLKGSRKSIFIGGTCTLQRREGEKLLYYPPKTSHWKLASKNWNIRFWNWNIRFLKYSRYRLNQTLRFENQNIRFFSVWWEVECMRPLCFTHLTWVFRLYEHWDFVGNPCDILLDRAAFLYSR